MLNCPCCGSVYENQTGIMVDIVTGLMRVKWSQITVKLTKREAELLSILLGCRGMQEEREKIIKKLWGINTKITTRGHVSNLIKGINNSINVYGLKIDNIHSYGYKLITISDKSNAA